MYNYYFKLLEHTARWRQYVINHLKSNSMVRFILWMAFNGILDMIDMINVY